MDSYLLIEERLYNSDADLWKQCREFPACEKVQYEYYYAKSRCESIDSYGDPIDSYEDPEQEFQEE